MLNHQLLHDGTVARKVFTLDEALNEGIGEFFLVEVAFLDELVYELTVFLNQSFHVLALLGQLCRNAINQLQHVVQREIAHLPLVEDVVLYAVANFLGVLFACCGLSLIELDGSQLTEQFVVPFLAESFEFGQRLVLLFSYHTPFRNDTSPISCEWAELILVAREYRLFEQKMFVADAPFFLKVCAHHLRSEVFVGWGIAITKIVVPVVESHLEQGLASE